MALRDNLALQHLISRKAVGTGVELHTTVVVDGFDSLAKYVDVGMGIAIMPKFHADAARATYDVIALPLLEDWAVRTTYICVKSVSGLGPAAKLVLEALLAQRRWQQSEEP